MFFGRFVGLLKLLQLVGVGLAVRVTERQLYAASVVFKVVTLRYLSWPASPEVREWMYTTFDMGSDQRSAPA